MIEAAPVFTLSTDGGGAGSEPGLGLGSPLSPLQLPDYTVTGTGGRPSFHRKDSVNSFVTTDSGVYSATNASSQSAGSIGGCGGSLRSRTDSCRTLTEDLVDEEPHHAHGGGDECDDDAALRQVILDTLIAERRHMQQQRRTRTGSDHDDDDLSSTTSSDGEHDEMDARRQVFYGAPFEKSLPSTTTTGSPAAEVLTSHHTEEEEDSNHAYCRQWAEDGLNYYDQLFLYNDHSHTTTTHDEAIDTASAVTGRASTPPPTASYRDGKARLIPRCQSLISALKSNPRTPRRKKMVRFADALGLDLEHIRHIILDDHLSSLGHHSLMFDGSYDSSTTLCDPDDTYYYQSYQRSSCKSVAGDASTSSHVTSSHVPSSSSQQRRLLTRFVLPSASAVRRTVAGAQRVCLDAFSLTGMCATGYVKVANVAFHKEVNVRYSLDNWASWSEARATYVPGSSDGFVDKFVFVVFLPTDLPVASVCRFAIRYRTNGQEYWDNNGGNNYIFECVVASASGSAFGSGSGQRSAAPRMLETTAGFFDQAWMHYF